MSLAQMRAPGRETKYTPHRLAWGVSSMSQGATATAATPSIQEEGKVPQDLRGLHPTK